MVLLLIIRGELNSMLKVKKDQKFFKDLPVAILPISNRRVVF